MTTNGEKLKFLKDYISKKNHFHWDEIQKILDEKEKGKIDINLDILYKIHNNGHNECVQILNKMEELFGDLK